MRVAHRPHPGGDNKRSISTTTSLIKAPRHRSDATRRLPGGVVGVIQRIGALSLHVLMMKFTSFPLPPMTASTSVLQTLVDLPETEVARFGIDSNLRLCCTSFSSFFSCLYIIAAWQDGQLEFRLLQHGEEKAAIM